jgi:hypothetical protein
MFLYELKLIHQIFFLILKFPHKKFIGNGDPLQISKLFDEHFNAFDDNKYLKLLGLSSRLFKNTIELKIQ